MFGGGSNTTNDGFANELFFTAGIDDEEHGLFGKLTASAKGNRGENGQGNGNGD